MSLTIRDWLVPGNVVALVVCVGSLARPLAAADGDPLSSGIAAFDVGGGLTDTAKAVAVQADGRIVLAGSVNTGPNAWSLALARFLPNGVPDGSFGSGGKVLNPFGLALSTFGSAVTLLADGRILVAGSQDWGGGNFDFLIGRLLADGQVDSTFAAGSGFKRIAFDRGGDLTDEAAVMVVDSSGRILLAGTVDTGSTDRDFAVVRLLANGDGDVTFGTNSRVVVGYPNAGVDVARAIAIDGSGRILVGGATHTATTFDSAVIRLLDSGALDATLHGDGRWWALHDGGNDYVNALAVQPDGKILLAGEDWLASGLWRWMVQRLLPTGTWDATFSGDGFQGGNFLCGVEPAACADRDTAWGIALQGDGRMVIAGVGKGAAADFDFGAARLLADGDGDLMFGWSDRQIFDATMTFDFGRGPGGHDDYGYALALAPDGRLVVAGTAEWNGFDTDFAWVRLDNAYIFADGFEWGDRSRWSSTTP